MNLVFPAPAQRPLPLLGLALCVVAGLLQAVSAGWTAADPASDAVPIDHPVLAQWSWALQALAAALYFACLNPLRAAHPRHTVLLAAAFGWTWQTAGIWWLFIGMNTYAGLAAPWAALAVLALAAYLTVYTVVASVFFTVITRRLAKDEQSTSMAPLLTIAAAYAGAWLLAEMGRAIVMGGFPWASSGYAHLQGPFRPLLPWLGVYGTAAVVAGLAALVVIVLTSPRLRAKSRLGAAGIALACMGGLAWLPNQDFTQSAGEFEVSLLQGNVSQDTKFKDQHVGRALNWYTHELSRSYADVTMAPETALPVLPESIPRDYWQRLERRTASHPGLLLLGVPQATGTQGHTNTLLGLAHADTWVQAPPGGIFRYHKQHLVPFAEFTPWGFGWFTRKLDLPLPSFETLAGGNSLLRLKTRSGTEQAIAPLICFEDLFGEDFAHLFRDHKLAPTAFANASNLAWFDDAPAMAQHLRFAQARSLEFQRPTFRATNTGPTVVINHMGEVTRALQPRQVGVLTAVVEGRTGITPYAYWLARWGLWPLVAAGLLLLALPYAASRRQAQNSAPAARAATLDF
jgi:apolipoprotein N-acyltransferase